ncbi:UNVERIFIED_CONTAM: hypothetical protein Slati_3127900 [Sesamum latifolium]|uniref:Zinc knuckle CX2CX4HX4C domain-containing protein n=1 Tax=Sesamum latifolium TaxID=2727402 RepID=A0AAW2UXP9_9LAMI
MDSLTMMMERVSYARILVEVDASKKLVDEVEFILPNGVARKQPVVYEFTPKFCLVCNCFGHLKELCQGTHPPAAAAATIAATTIKTVALKKMQNSEWMLVQRRHKNLKHFQQQQQQQQNPPAADSDDHSRQGTSQQELKIPTTGIAELDRPGPSRQEQNLMGQGQGQMQTRWAEIEKRSPIGSSDSSTDSGSPSMTELVTPVALKWKQKLGGDAPPHSS